MTSIRTRLLAVFLAAVLALGVPLTALADELPATPGGEDGSSADLLDVTVPDYTPDSKAGDVSKIQKGARYTLIALPSSVAVDGSTPKALTAELLTTADPLFIGSAVASDNGKVTFTDIHLRSAEAAVYYVTGPGLTQPLVEATSKSVSVEGFVRSPEEVAVKNATVSVADKATGYAYPNAATSDRSGYYSFSRIAPGTYNFLISKPGYLPATVGAGVVIPDNTTYLLEDFDYSPYIGDFNNDGERNLTDLTDFLTYYQNSSLPAPQSFTLDLSEDGAVTTADLKLFLDAADVCGSGDAASVSLAARDVTVQGAANHTLLFSLQNAADGLTFTAASVSLTFRTDYIQPVNQNGGVVYPGSANSSANCLVPRSGVTVSDPRWDLTGNQATLTFSLSCKAPTALTDLVEFRYRPAPGKTTADFFPGVFSVPHAAALVGADTVLTDCPLTYLNSTPLALTSITIDQKDAILTIPDLGRPLTLALTATGHTEDGDDHPNLSGVTWSVSTEDGGVPGGVSVSDNLLVITSDAQSGKLLVTAACGGVTSDPLTLTLKNADPVAQQISILRDDEVVTGDALAGDVGTEVTASYTAKVTDQYGAVMDGQTVAWSLSGAPEGISVSGGKLTAAATLPAGTYSFSLLAGLDGLRAAVNITLTLESQVHQLILSGPSSVQIPSGSKTLTLSYILSAVDAKSQAIPLPAVSPSLSVAREDGSLDIPGVTPDVSMNGDLTVTVTGEAQPGTYTLRVTADDYTADDLTLTLQSAGEEAAPVRAAIFYDDVQANALELLCLHGGDSSGGPKFYPRLLDQEGKQVKASPWGFTVTGLPEDKSISYVISTDYLELDTRNAPCGDYFLTLSAEESASGLSVTVPVHLTVFPRVTQIRLQAPDTLTVPVSGTLRYPISATYLDGFDETAAPFAVTPPGPVTWSVWGADNKTPAGVTIQDGVLTVTSAAKPGEITVHVECEAPTDYASGFSMASQNLKLTLAPSATAQEKVLSLRRDGELLSGGVDSTYGKEGSAITLSYTPVLRDSDGNITELAKKDVTWMGVPGEFTVDGKAEPGVYTTPVTALYEGQSVSLTAQITVYPDITNLYVSFDEGDKDSDDESYSFTVPTRAAKTYYGTLMATITRGGQSVDVPLSQLDLTDYDIDIYTPLTGLYLSYDRDTGRLALTIEPVASTNSMRDPSPGVAEIRYLGIDFSYYPGQKPLELEQTMLLTRENAVTTNVVLRQGHGAGANFVFETARPQSSLTAAPGTLSDCFALELLDQYGDPVAAKNASITMTVSSPNADVPGLDTLISLEEPNEVILSSYSRFACMRRLHISPETPSGSYVLYVTAKAGDFTFSTTVSLTVSGTETLSSISLISSSSTATIPQWYSAPNSSSLNNKTTTVPYTAVALSANGVELDPSPFTFTWDFADAKGNRPNGVSIAAGADTSSATVTIDRTARLAGSSGTPTQVQNPITVSVSTPDPAGGDALFAEKDLNLSRSTLRPYLLTIQGPSSLNLGANNTSVTEDYTFRLIDQYNYYASSQYAQQVSWSISGSRPSYVSTSTLTQDGQSVLRLRVRNPGYNASVILRLTASIYLSSYDQTITQSRSVSIVISGANGGGDIGGGDVGGGDVGGEELPVTTSTVTPTTSKSGTTGTVSLSTEEIDTLTNTTATGTLTIAPKNTSGLTSITVSVPVSLARALAAKPNSLRIQTAQGTLTLPAAALKLPTSLSGNLSITILNQDNKLSLTLKSGSGGNVSLPAQATFQASVKGDTFAVADGSQTQPQNAAISNGSFTAKVSGSFVLTVSTKPKGKVFSDTHNHWAKSAVEFVTARGLFQGTSETTFSPDGQMTRGMVVTVLHRLASTPSSSATNAFRDVPSSTWYTDAVVWANAQGIVQGNGDGFLPDDPVTREQLATILYRYMQGRSQTAGQRASLSSFSDSANVSPWAQEAMEWAVSTGLITGKTGGVLDPSGRATRAEVATMFERLVNNIAPAAE